MPVGKDTPVISTVITGLSTDVFSLSTPDHVTIVVVALVTLLLGSFVLSKLNVIIISPPRSSYLISLFSHPVWLRYLRAQ